MTIRQIIYFICISFISCQQGKPNNGKDKKGVVIDLQPFSRITAEEKKYVFTELRKIYPRVELKGNIDLPSTAYYASRNRYRADSVISYLRQHVITGHIIIGLTNKDISTTKDSISDWGVMGLGFCPGEACIASSFRLSKEEKNSQLFKVAVHELGHTQGLSQCSVSTCFMRDAEGGNYFNEEKEFCQKCTSYLITKAWRF
jgi:archaemetzincin